MKRTIALFAVALFMVDTFSLIAQPSQGNQTAATKNLRQQMGGVIGGTQHSDYKLNSHRTLTTPELEFKPNVAAGLMVIGDTKNKLLFYVLNRKKKVIALDSCVPGIATSRLLTWIPSAKENYLIHIENHGSSTASLSMIIPGDLNLLIEDIQQWKKTGSLEIR
jgi:hypothetical protein